MSKDTKKLDEIVRKMKIIEVEFDDGHKKWKEMYDATLGQLSVPIIIKAEAIWRDAYIVNETLLSTEQILERLKASVNSDKFEDKFLRERVRYWNTV